MKLRLAPRALAEAKRIKSWWRENRPAAPDLFEQELDAALERIRAVPSSVGTLYEQGDLEVPVRRILLRKTENYGNAGARRGTRGVRAEREKSPLSARVYERFPLSVGCYAGRDE